MKIRRGYRLRQRYLHAKARRRENGITKSKERARRDERMAAILKDGSPPYTPDVMSWMSRKLDKPSTKITPEDVAALSC